MLVVKTRLGPSAIDGLGLFAAEPIAQGQIVWVHNPDVDRFLSLTEDTPAAFRAFIDRYAACKGADSYFLCGDDTRFLNHSDEPNIVSTGDLTPGLALRDIAVGDELTIDYRTIDVKDAVELVLSKEER